MRNVVVQLCRVKGEGKKTFLLLFPSTTSSKTFILCFIKKRKLLPFTFFSSLSIQYSLSIFHPYSKANANNELFLLICSVMAFILS